MTCKDCQKTSCHDCEWLRSEDFKNCKHKKTQPIQGHEFKVCLDCRRILPLAEEEQNSILCDS